MPIYKVFFVFWKKENIFISLAIFYIILILYLDTILRSYIRNNWDIISFFLDLNTMWINDAFCHFLRVLLKVVRLASRLGRVLQGTRKMRHCGNDTWVASFPYISKYIFISIYVLADIFLTQGDHFWRDQKKNSPKLNFWRI